MLVRKTVKNKQIGMVGEKWKEEKP
ncbi:MAG: hypothetical protein XE12_0414, partial [Synergistales bacterium 54_9]